MASVPAFEKQKPFFTVAAGSDLSGNQYCAVKYSSGSLAVASALGEKVIGILQNKPSASGRAGVVKFGDISKVTLGGTVSQGGALVAGASSTLVAQTDPDQFVVGFALSDGASGERISAMITLSGAMSSQGATGAVQYAEIDVTSTELLALNATPKTLVAAPGAGYVTEFMSAVLVLDYNSAAYASNGILGVYETDASGTVVSDTVAQTDFLGKTADTIVAVQALSADTALLENKPLVLTQATGESITGDSPIRVKVSYRIHATGL